VAQEATDGGHSLRTRPGEARNSRADLRLRRRDQGLAEPEDGFRLSLLRVGLPDIQPLPPLLTILIEATTGPLPAGPVFAAGRGLSFLEKYGTRTSTD
jgi:hypothetical protein